MTGARRPPMQLDAPVNSHEQLSLEKSVGILERVSPDRPDWTGKMRVRFTDFQVNEIQPDGNVVHLSSIGDTSNKQTTHGLTPTVPKANPSQTPPSKGKLSVISEADKQQLSVLVGADDAEKLVELDIQVQKDCLANRGCQDTVIFGPIDDRAQRTEVHKEIRRIFSSRLHTAIDVENKIVASLEEPSGYRTKPKGRKQRSTKSSGALGDGDYLHLTLHKENRDTMDAISHMSRVLRIKPADVRNAGTKDRRASTAQRVSIYRGKPNHITKANGIYGIHVGDFKFEKSPLQLGDLLGNEFVITLKECLVDGAGDISTEKHLELLETSVKNSLESTASHGFLNYYGLQRFGTYNIGTHEVGKRILQGDFEAAVDSLLHYDPRMASQDQDPTVRPSVRDEMDRARACALFQDSKTTGDVEGALKLLPRKFTAESMVLRHLSKTPKDYCGALVRIPRGLRTMYPHAYQSFVWNHMASMRWNTYGEKIVEGDLIIMPKRNADDGIAMEVDQDGEMVLNPTKDNGAEDHEEARPLTKQEAESGDYSLRQVVLPTPGWGIVYPANAIGDAYKHFMGLEENGALDPFSMRRPQKDFSLSGSYRQLIGHFITAPESEVMSYHDNTDQLAKTDLDRINEAKAMEQRNANQKKEQRLANLSASTGAWNNFAQNAEKHDLAIAQEYQDEDRRRRLENPDVDFDNTRISKTWIQMSGPETAKRLKVARDERNIDKPAQVEPLSAQVDTPQPPQVQVEALQGQVEVSQDQDECPQGQIHVSQDPRAVEVADPEISQQPTTTQGGSPMKANKTANTSGSKLAVVLKFQLHSSQYATMALRELTSMASASNIAKEEA